MGKHGLDTSGPGQGPVEGSCEHSNEPSESITLNMLQLFKKDFISNYQDMSKMYTTRHVKWLFMFPYVN
jgi:hypothetical protein